MRTTQVLIAVGGRARRLRGGGIDVPVSKAFMEVEGLPILYWNLVSMHKAGIRRLVICGDRNRQLSLSRRIIRRLRRRGLAEFDEIVYFKDEGLGVHGLPYQARGHLDDRFFFDCGHSLMEPEHYRRLDGAKTDAGTPGAVVFSAFDGHPANPRQPVTLDDNLARPFDAHEAAKVVLAHPFLVDRLYTDSLPDLGFSIERILAHYMAQGMLHCVQSTMPPEFDIREEYDAALATYGSYTETLLSGRQELTRDRPGAEVSYAITPAPPEERSPTRPVPRLRARTRG